MKLIVKKRICKFLCLYFSFCLGFLNCLILPVQVIAQDVESESLEEQNDESIQASDELGVLKGRVSKVPSGTKLRIIVETPIDENTSKIGDEFTARTTDDITIEGNVVVPVGSTVIGQITEINSARRLHKSGSVRIEFKSLTTSDGRQIPIVASVLTRSGLLKGKYTAKRTLIAGATVVGPAAAGFGAGLAAEGSPLGGGIGATIGLITGLALFAFQRGNPVDIKAGNEFKIELTEDVLVPKVGEEEKIKQEEQIKINNGEDIDKEVLKKDSEDTNSGSKTKEQSSVEEDSAHVDD